MKFFTWNDIREVAGKTEKNDKPVDVGRRISLEHEFRCTEIIEVHYTYQNRRKKNKIVAIPVSNRGTPLEGVHKRKRRGYRADRFISTVERADLDLTDLPALPATQTRVFRRSRAAIYRSLRAFRRENPPSCQLTGFRNACTVRSPRVNLVSCWYTFAYVDERYLYHRSVYWYGVFMKF